MPGSLESSPLSLGEKIVSSDDILSGRTEILIEHQGAIYRLRVTRQNKLILTK
ncbi:Hemin uptake protein HemP [Devosia crocina]|uniref:Hemin uptake protein HemP n=1 Tax=Devosia crocina TaxID=429728 RepID=A0A1I7NUN6_9HYPH|nr:hemin uptake protein HemP [Devosia crocina]SFV38367.1 Hemin uptake protein HemP [Devosia crocina]